MRHALQISLGDVRLDRRIRHIIQMFTQHSARNAAGPAIPADTKTQFAVTQALWRFLNNPKITPQKLVQPLLTFAKEQQQNILLQKMPIISNNLMY